MALQTTVHWSNGDDTDETDTAEYITSDANALTVSPPPGPQVTVHVIIPPNPSIGEIVARFWDPCSYLSAFTFHLSFGAPAMAYEYASQLPEFPICNWRPICYGTCGSSLYSSLAVNTPSCFPDGAPYLQCYGLTVNGKCILRNAVCGYLATPGYCS